MLCYVYRRTQRIAHRWMVGVCLVSSFPFHFSIFSSLIILCSAWNSCEMTAERKNTVWKVDWTTDCKKKAKLCFFTFRGGKNQQQTNKQKNMHSKLEYTSRTIRLVPQANTNQKAMPFGGKINVAWFQPLRARNYGVSKQLQTFRDVDFFTAWVRFSNRYSKEFVRINSAVRWKTALVCVDICVRCTYWCGVVVRAHSYVETVATVLQPFTR